METPIQILSKEIIKPSSPTPNHLRNMKLSYLDQLMPRMHIPIIFFYQANEPSGLSCSNHSYISKHLKHSLSNILPSFYPLAGTFKDHSLIDCNDAGVEFIQARAQAYLADTIQEHNINALHQYAPVECCKETLLAVKLTFFKCGGISIGICFSHKLADCESIMAFVYAWAMTCRGEPDSLKFKFNLANHFPARNLSNCGNSMRLYEEKLVIKRFLFNKEVLMVLKKEATSPLVTNPTKVEAVSAFIWKHFIEVAKYKASSTSTILPATHAVNLRRRTKKPPHSLENVFGNCVMTSVALYNTKSLGVSNLYQDLVSKLRSSIMKIDEDYIMKAQTGDRYLRDLHEFSSMLVKGEVIEPCDFSSWCKFPIYEVNYGWGNPIWACTTAIPVKNDVVLMDTKCGQGIEAWISTEEAELEMLDNQIKLISSNVKGKD